jgi:putative membrane protein
MKEGIYMFIYNIKLSGSKIFKILLFLIIVFIIILCGIVVYKIYNESINDNKCVKYNETTELTNKNYATILKAVHENIDMYVGQKIKFSGFVYRVYDLESNQFVLGRNMIISSDFQTVVVGFLCNYENAVNLADNCWIEIEGTITKGTYHGDMPILEITNLKQIEKPTDEYVYPPDENYIPTISNL